MYPILGDPQSFHYGSPYSVNKSVFTVYLGGDCVQKKTRTAVVHCAPAIDCRMPKHNSDLYLFFFFEELKDWSVFLCVYFAEKSMVVDVARQIPESKMPYLDIS